MSKIITFLILHGTNALFFLIPTTLLIIYRKEDIIQKRGVALLIVGSITTFIVTIGQIYQFRYYGQFQPQCFVLSICANFFAPIVMITHLTRMLLLVYNKCKIFSGRDSNEFNFIERLSCNYFSFYKRNFTVVERRSMEPKKLVKRSLNGTLTNISPEQEKQRTSLQFPGIIRSKVLLISLIPFVVIFLLSLLVPLLTFSYELLSYDNCPNVLIFTPALVYLAFTIIAIPIMSLSIFKIHDGLDIRNELLLTALLSSFLVVPFVAGNFYPVIIPHLVGNSIYPFLICYVSHFNSTIYPLLMVLAQKHRRKELNVNAETYQRVMRDPILFKELKALMEKELCLENAMFIEEFTLLKSRSLRVMQGSQASLFETPTQSNREYLQTATIELYERFIAVGSKFELNLSSAVTERIRGIISGSLKLELEVFETILAEVHRNVYDNTFQRYVAASMNEFRNV